MHTLRNLRKWLTPYAVAGLTCVVFASVAATAMILYLFFGGPILPFVASLSLAILAAVLYWAKKAEKKSMGGNQ